MHLAALMTGPPAARRPGASAEPPRADFFAAKGVLAALLGALRVPWRSCAASDPFLHPGRAARVLVAGEDAGWLGELHPGVAAEWDLGPRSRLRARPRRRAPARRRRAALRGPDVSFPAIRQDLAFWIPAGPRPRPSWSRSCAARGGKLLRACRVFDVYAREGQTLAGRAAGVPRDRPHADRRGDRAAREKIVAAVARQAGGRAAWLAAVAVLGAAGYAGAIAAQLLYRHPFFELAHVDRARGGRPAARRRAPAHAGAAGARVYDPDSSARPTRPSSPTRTAPPRRSWPSCATAACASWTSPPTSGCATAASTRTGTASTARPSSSGRASTGCRSSRARTSRGADLVANPAATRRRRCSGSRRWPGPG